MNGYIGVSGLARKIKTMYIGVDGLARKVKKGYVGVNNVARQWYSSGYPDPPTEYESVSLGTWSSISDVDTFLSTYTPENGYNGLKLGNYVTIKPGTTGTKWEIAGFNCEYNATASDGTTYNNGPGIMMIPKTYGPGGGRDWGSDTTREYINSTIHSYINSTTYTSLATILGNHIINRNVLLGSNCPTTVPTTWYTTEYTWTTAYLTLMSVGQCTGTFASHHNLYDDGEANYKLPLFNYESFKISYWFWFRNAAGYDGTHFCAYTSCKSTETGTASAIPAYYTKAYSRPLMMLR